MKLYYSLQKPYLSPSLGRIWEGLDLTKPEGAVWVEEERDADFIFNPVVNYQDFKNVKLDSRHVLFQLCYLTAGGSPFEWAEIWSKVGLIVSYLDLPWEYLLMPLGYDPAKFYPEQLPKKYKAMTTGYVDGPGAEYIKAVWEAFGDVIHVGHDFKFGKGYHNASKLSDNQLRALYSSSEYIVSLRDVEGFELPLIEGAACGAIPVALDLPCYKKWFYDTAQFVSRDNLVEDLRNLLPGSPPDVRGFEWANVMKPLWRTLWT